MPDPSPSTTSSSAVPALLRHAVRRPRPRRSWQERRALLLEDAAISREPWLEPIAPYATAATRPSRSPVRRAGAHPDLAAFASLGLLPAGAHLRTHQFEALAGAPLGQHVIVTAGTGSGKTEAFLLPLFSSLLEESERWGRDGSAGHGRLVGSAEKPQFQPQRERRDGPEAAVRALVLYPMNALVDDQLMRLRRALDSDAARAPGSTRNRGGHRFYFGRYTGRTPVAGASRQQPPASACAQQLTPMAERARARPRR